MRWLWDLSGDDSFFIRNCGWDVKLLFAGIGFMVLILFVLCFCSGLYATIQVTDSQLAGWIIGIFFSYMFCNLYLLILFTLSRNVLPHKKEKTGVRLSRALRFSFLLMVGVLVSKPLEYWLFKEDNERLVREYKQQQMETHQQLVARTYNQRILETKQALNSVSHPGGQREFYEWKLIRLEQDFEIDKDKVVHLLDRSNFFIQGMGMHHKLHPATWLLTLATMVVFIAPAILKLCIPPKSKYLKNRIYVERKIVRDGYKLARGIYTAQFFKTVQRLAAYPENYLDPPFRLRKKTVKSRSKKQEEFIKLLYRS